MSFSLHACRAQTHETSDDGFGLQDLGTLVLRNKISKALRFRGVFGLGGRLGSAELARCASRGIKRLLNIKYFFAKTEAQGSIGPADNLGIGLALLE